MGYLIRNSTINMYEKYILAKYFKVISFKRHQVSRFLWFCGCGMMIYMVGGYAMQSTLYCAEKFKKDCRILHKEHKVGRVILKTDFRIYVVVVTVWA